MAIATVRFDRRDGADRGALGMAALEYCRAVRKQFGAKSRFFWTGPDSIVILSEADSQQVFDEAPDATTAAAFFAVADLARQTGQERWLDPRDGLTAYGAAGRA